MFVLLFAMMKMTKKHKRVALYTVIIGKYDKGVAYSNPLETVPLLEAAYFVSDDTDQCIDAKKKGWDVIQVPRSKNPKQYQRSLKILQNFHPDLKKLNKYDVLVYHDGNNFPNREIINFDKYIDALLTNDVVCFAHPTRKTCSDEVKEVMRQNLISHDSALKAEQIYKVNGFNDDIGLTDTRLLFRTTRPRIQPFLQLWYSLMIENNVWRDQVFFDYSLWKKNVPFKRCSQFLFDRRFNHEDPLNQRHAH